MLLLVSMPLISILLQIRRAEDLSWMDQPGSYRQTRATLINRNDEDSDGGDDNDDMAYNECLQHWWWYIQTFWVYSQFNSCGKHSIHCPHPKFFIKGAHSFPAERTLGELLTKMLYIVQNRYPQLVFANHMCL